MCRDGLPIAILHRKNIKKEEDRGHLKLGKVYSVKLNDGLYEDAKLLYSGNYISYSNYVTWFLAKKTKGTRARIKRKRDEDDDNVQVEKNPKRMKH